MGMCMCTQVHHQLSCTENVLTPCTLWHVMYCPVPGPNVPNMQPGAFHSLPCVLRRVHRSGRRGKRALCSASLPYYTVLYVQCAFEVAKLTGFKSGAKPWGTSNARARRSIGEDLWIVRANKGGESMQQRTCDECMSMQRQLRTPRGEDAVPGTPVLPRGTPTMTTPVPNAVSPHAEPFSTPHSRVPSGNHITPRQERRTTSGLATTPTTPYTPGGVPCVPSITPQQPSG